MDKTEIQFLRTKDFKFVKELGRGGFGKSILLKDELINEEFVCKKYSPYYEEHKKSYFQNFIDEIKLLHLVYHNNIVRVFNYYLYPIQFTGYILMEYIKGKNIQEYIKSNPNEINNIFVQTIEGFKHLEELKILHRDIRPQNILVSDKGIVKIIDFGFGKKIEFDDNYDKSISLNWLYSPPNEFLQKKYDFKTEIYFIGKLFDELIKENNIENFIYFNILNQMINVNYEERTKSFFNISRIILDGKFKDIEFSIDEKEIYLNFASRISSLYSVLYNDAEYISDIDIIIQKLEEVYQSSMLEIYLQNLPSLCRCFIKGGFKYFLKREIEVSIIKNFINFLKSLPNEKQRIVINNLWNRFDSIDRIENDKSSNPFDDLPF